MRTPVLTALVLAVSTAGFAMGCARSERGTLVLETADGRDSVSARVTILDETGGAVVPEEALAVFGDCGQVPVHLWIPAAARIQARWGRHRGVPNPYRGTTDAYTSGRLTASLSPGRYRVRIEKGPEFRVAEETLTIVAGAESRVRIALERWIDLPSEGWWSADDHLHIPRPDEGLDPVIATWMRAEDLHVANLLQMGLSREFHVTPQRAFGPRSLYREGQTLLVSGQENPRTHVLGHAILLGAHRWIDFPATYLLYDRPFREARRQGGLAGYAHFAIAGAEDGVAVWGHEEILDFIEVLNFGFPYYRTWYEALDLGLRVVPTAGTDYPCLPSLPGRERFYTRAGNELTFEGWLDGVRRGRTFVTNGPMIELEAAGVGIGDELLLDAPQDLRLRARVRFDPSRDRVERLEIVRGGEVIAARDAGETAGEIVIDEILEISRSTWITARASGEKVGETPVDSIEGGLAYLTRLGRAADASLADELVEAARPGRARPSAAHTAPIHVSVRGTPPIAEQQRAREVAAMWIARLDDLVARLGDDRIESLAGFPGEGDGMTREDLLEGRAALLEAIESARRAYRARIARE